MNCVDLLLLKKMKAAGCHLILFGVETADKTIQKTIKKSLSLEKVKESVALAKSAGLDTRVSFMFGNPGETEDTMKKTLNFALELDPDEVHFNITTVFPGTEMYDWAKKNRYINSNDWSRYNESEIVMELPTVSKSLLLKHYKAAHLKFYLRKKVIFRRLKKISTFTQLRQELRGLLAIL